ncbi:MAG: hypothetical protein JF587_21000 [Catenulisporales bacterium]|nr:hypothetical protein [Catenulisporales bacterium]
MTGSPSAAIDYGRFADRLAAQRASQDPAKRWDLYREFQQEWGYVPTGGERWEGGDPVDPDDEELDEDELEALVPPEKIPAALSEWWKLPFNSFADSWPMYWTNPVWPPTWRPDPSGYGVAEGLEADSPLVVDPKDLRLCCFNAEYEYCNEWAYLSAEAHLPDPRVFVSVEHGWELQADSLSEFFLLLAATRLPASLGWTASPDDDFDAVAARVRATMPALGFHPWRELMSTKVFHGGRDVLAMVDPTGQDVQLCLYGRSREALERATASLGGEWSIAEPNPPKREDEEDEEDE